MPHHKWLPTVHGVCVCSLLCVCTWMGEMQSTNFEYRTPYLGTCHALYFKEQPLATPKWATDKIKEECHEAVYLQPISPPIIAYISVHQPLRSAFYCHSVFVKEACVYFSRTTDKSKKVESSHHENTFCRKVVPQLSLQKRSIALL